MHGISEYINNLLAYQDPLLIQAKIIDYILHLKNDKKLSAITIRQYIEAIMHFYSMNDITLNRKKLACISLNISRNKKILLIL